MPRKQRAAERETTAPVSAASHHPPTTPTAEEETGSFSQRFYRSLRIAIYSMLIYSMVSGLISSKRASDAMKSGELMTTRIEPLTPAPATPPPLPPIRYHPLASNLDIFDLSVDVYDEHSGQTYLTSPIHFTELPWDYAGLNTVNPRETQYLNLSACFESNCSLVLQASWTMKGKNFTLPAPYPLITFRQKSDVQVKRSLLGAASQEHQGDATLSDEEAKKAADVPMKMFFQPMVSLSGIVDFSSPLNPQLLPLTPVIDDEEQRSGKYGPAVIVNAFYVLQESLVEVTREKSLSTLHAFEVEVFAISAWKALFYERFTASMKQQKDVGLLQGGTGSDDVKRLLMDNSPLYLFITMTVTVLHMLFASLAMKSDVEFWRGRKDFVGISLRTLLINCYSETIIFLYLLEDSNTSWGVRIPCGLGVLAEFWKLCQTIQVTKKAPPPLKVKAEEPHGKQRKTAESLKDNTQSSQSSSSPYILLRFLEYELQFVNSYDSETRVHDDTAVRTLLYIAAPLLVLYASYSAIYDTYSGWYGFLLHTQVQFIYFFGFALMTPQVFINYKMKSVGQLPWRTFIYKALNTVVDDFFAFAIPMPLLHRLACFRDDVIFAVLLYQRWLYPVDTRRLFGETDCLSSSSSSSSSSDSSSSAAGDEGMGEAKRSGSPEDKSKSKAELKRNPPSDEECEKKCDGCKKKLTN